MEGDNTKYGNAVDFLMELLSLSVWNSTHQSKEVSNIGQCVSSIQLGHLYVLNYVEPSLKMRQAEPSLWCHGLNCSWRSEEISQEIAAGKRTRLANCLAYSEGENTLKSVKEKWFWGQGNQSKHPDSSRRPPKEWQYYKGRCHTNDPKDLKIAYIVFRGQKNIEKWRGQLCVTNNNCIILDKLLVILYLELLKKFPSNPPVFLYLTFGRLSPGSSITVSRRGLKKRQKFFILYTAFEKVSFPFSSSYSTSVMIRLRE